MLKSPSTLVLTIAFIVIFAALATAQTGQPLVPLLDEVIINPTTGRATAYFGYTNPNTNTVTINIGEPNNYFFPSPQNRGQVTRFLPGTHHYAFAAVWIYADEPSISWILNNTAVTADSASAARQAQTTAFNYQGKLSDSTNANPTGTYQMQFALFDAASGGTQIGSTLTNASVNVANGIFSVTLDFGSNPFVSGANRFLEIGVKRSTDSASIPFSVLAPRQQLTSAPFSIRTISAGEADTLSNFCVSCVQDAQINSVNGAKVIGAVSNATNSVTANTAATAGNVTGVVAIANGGTGSQTQNFVDLTTNQTIAGEKTFSGANAFFGGTVGVANRFGIGINTPLFAQHIRTDNTPGIRLEQTNAGGFTPQTWDIAGNEANFFVRDLNNGNGLPFRIRPGAPTSSIDIATNGNVGFGNSSPQAKLDVRGGDIYVGTSNQGVILKSPDGMVCRRLTINNAGAIVLTSIACPQ